MIFNFFISKELKKYPFFFLLLSITLFLGTLGLVGINLVSSQVKDQLKSNARNLLTSDLVVSARREFYEGEIKELNQLMQQVPHETYQVIDIYSMIARKSTGQSRLVEIRSVEGNYPFYGKVSVANKDFSADEFYVGKDLNDLWPFHPDEEFIIGQVSQFSSGVVIEDSSVGLRGFSLAPRVYLPLSQVKKSGLLKPGATGSFAYHYKLESFSEEELKALRKKIYEKLTDPAIRVTLSEESSSQSARVINILSNFMSLSALIGLVLSLVGAFYLYQSHLIARLKDLSLLNLYGLQKWQLALGVLLQFSLIFLVNLIIQTIFLFYAYDFIAPNVSKYLGISLGNRMNLSSLISQVPFLYLLTISILVPLLFGILRSPLGQQLKNSRIGLARFKYYDFFPFLLMMALYSLIVGHSWTVGGIFFLCLMFVFLFSVLFIKAVQTLLRRAFNDSSLSIPSLEFAIALRNIYRSGSRPVLSFLSVSLGATLISLILQLDSLVQQEFMQNDKRPELFIFDIQEDQVSDLVNFAKKLKAPLEALSPMIRGRLDFVNGNKFIKSKSSMSLRDTEDEEESRARNTGLNLTYRENLSESEKIVEGKPFLKREIQEIDVAQISLEKRWAQRMGIKIGDILSFDIQGVPFEGKVVNYRSVKWTSFVPNFFVSVEPGFIDAAPKTYLVVLTQVPRTQKILFQQEAVKEFPNISFIDVEELVKKLTSIFNRSRLAIELISWLSLGVGLLILYGLTHDQIYRRYYDVALMKGLGLSSKQLLRVLVFEFGTTFILAVGLGFFLGWSMAQIIGIEIFKLEVSINWQRVIAPFIILIFICLSTILLASWRVRKIKPRELLGE